MTRYFSTQIKSAIRASQYLHITELWKRSHRPKGVTLTLAGPKAPEVPLLRAMGFADEDIILVDRDAEVREECRRLYPDCPLFSSFDAAFTFLGDRKIAIANLDYMGSISSAILRTASSVGERLASHGVVLYTFLRGRENSEMKKDMGTVHGSLEADRVASYTTKMIKALGPQRFRSVYLNRYTNITLPMGQLGFQAIGRTAPSSAWEKFVTKHMNEHSVINEKNSEELLKTTMRWLRKRGFDSYQIAEITGNPDVPSVRSFIANLNRNKARLTG